MPVFKSQSFLWQILSTIGIVSAVFMLITLLTLAYFMVVPLGQRATDDLASIIAHTAERWDSLPTAEREEFTEDMLNKHELVLTTADAHVSESTSMLPYLYFLIISLK